MSNKEQVLRALQENARLSNSQIAERLEMSEDDVARIIADAESDHAILGYTALIRDQALSKQPVRALIEVNVEPERDLGFDRVARRISKFSEVRDVMLISGNFDLLLIVEGENLHMVADFVASKLSPMEGVRSTRTHFMLRRYKEAGFTFEADKDFERLRVTP